MTIGTAFPTDPNNYRHMNSMTVTPAGVAFIKARERFSWRLRTDAGHPEIGWGHDVIASDPALAAANVDKAKIMAGAPITRAEGDAIFAWDLRGVEAVINSYVTVPLAPNQFDALADFVYNVGETNFRNSALLRLLNGGDYAGAANEFPRWVYSRGKLVHGLRLRRVLEENMFRHGGGIASASLN